MQFSNDSVIIIATLLSIIYELLINTDMTKHTTLKDIMDMIRDARERFPEDEEFTGWLDDLENGMNDLSVNGIDFRAVADNLDDSLVIADGEGRYVYTNPSYTRNTGIRPEQIIGRTAEEIEADGSLFKRGAAIEVLRTKSKVFRISNVYVTDKVEPGAVSGVPIFNEDGDMTHIICASRPLFTFNQLKDDYKNFLDYTNSLENRPSIAPYREHGNSLELDSKYLIGTTPALDDIHKIIMKAAPTDATVLITGESGSGKEVVADEIYRLSHRSHAPFIKVNCASIPDNLLESELFGYEKGAFSGASSSGKKGLFELADNGTMMLDEIGDMPMDLQVKLLRAIQHKEITRIGGTKPIKLNIRFIAATNSDLRKKVQDGVFRQDLFYRLNVVPIHMPPLRERKSDIRRFCDYFLDMYNTKHDNSLTLTPSQYEMLENYQWPGNIRELENIIEYLSICGYSEHPEVNDYMLASMLEADAPDSSIAQTPSVTPVIPEMISEKSVEENEAKNMHASVEDYEKALIESVLMESKNLREAGAKLGVNASTVSRKIHAYGIEYPKNKKKQ